MPDHIREGDPLLRGVDFDSDNRRTVNGIVEARGSFEGISVESVPSEGRSYKYEDDEGSTQGRGGVGGSAQINDTVHGDNGRIRNRNTVNTATLGRAFARRPLIPVVLELGGRATDGASESKVCAFENLVIEDGTKDEDDGLISVGERGDRVESDPALDLRPIGVKSKF